MGNKLASGFTGFPCFVPAVWWGEEDCSDAIHRLARPWWVPELRYVNYTAPFNLLSVCTYMYVVHACTYMHDVRTLHVLFHTLCVAVTGRKRTLFHSKWVNSISYISRMLYWNHSRFSVSLYEWLNSMHSKFQSHSYFSYNCWNLYNSTYANIRFLPVTATCTPLQPAECMCVHACVRWPLSWDAECTIYLRT